MNKLYKPPQHLSAFALWSNPQEDYNRVNPGCLSKRYFHKPDNENANVRLCADGLCIRPCTMRISKARPYPKSCEPRLSPQATLKFDIW